jgi:hypothetical protein
LGILGKELSSLVIGHTALSILPFLELYLSTSWDDQTLFSAIGLTDACAFKLRHNQKRLFLDRVRERMRPAEYVRNANKSKSHMAPRLSLGVGHAAATNAEPKTDN